MCKILTVYEHEGHSTKSMFYVLFYLEIFEAIGPHVKIYPTVGLEAIPHLVIEVVCYPRNYLLNFFFFFFMLLFL